MRKNLMLGADPELFLVDAHGAFISAIDRIGGSKEFPRPLDELGAGFAVQEDNVALEYNIPPSASKISFVNNINRAMSYLSDMVSKQGLKLSNVSAVVFPQEQLQDPRALEFGCDPDFNAWTGKRNPRPKATDKALRSCGGHVHIGGIDFEGNKAEMQRFIKFMDLFAGVPSIVMDNGDLRKQLYGKPGAYRPKPYGVEYRVLSNFWTLVPKYTEWVWDAVSLAADAWQNKKIDIDEDKDLILSAINDNDKSLASRLIDKYNLAVA